MKKFTIFLLMISFQTGISQNSDIMKNTIYQFTVNDIEGNIFLEEKNIKDLPLSVWRKQVKIFVRVVLVSRWEKEMLYYMVPKAN